MLPEKPQRPEGEFEALEVSLAGDDFIIPIETTIVRCTRCGHSLTAPRSVALEMGPVCRELVAA